MGPRVSDMELVPLLKLAFVNRVWEKHRGEVPGHRTENSLQE